MREQTSLEDEWLLPCRFCGRFHVHRAIEQRVYARCHLYDDYDASVHPEWYRVKYAGEATPEIEAAYLAYCARRNRKPSSEEMATCN